MHDDAVPSIRTWNTSDDADVLVACHSGYQRLAEPVTPVRGVLLEHATHRLVVVSGFEGLGEHRVRIPLTFTPDCALENVSPDTWRITTAGRTFILVIFPADAWSAEVETAEVSVSYGVVQKASSLIFTRDGTLVPLAIALLPDDSAPTDPGNWLRRVSDGKFAAACFTL